MPPRGPPWQYSETLGGEYLYNPDTDQIILRNGRRYPRPYQIPKASLFNAEYRETPPSQNPNPTTPTQSHPTAAYRAPQPSQSPTSPTTNPTYVLRSGPSTSSGYAATGTSPGQAIAPITQRLSATGFSPSVQGARAQQNVQFAQQTGRSNLPVSQGVDRSNRQQVVAGSQDSRQSQNHPSAQQGAYQRITNPRSQVQVIKRTAPAHEITDRGLHSQGIHARQALYGTPGKTEKLFPEYKVRPNGGRFFKLGRVFMVLWAEPAGATSTLVSKETVTNHLGEMVYSKIRRFVVIREGELYCSALPIATYTGRGVSKTSTRKSEHVVIYTGRTVPEIQQDELPRRGEAGMRAYAIRVDPDNPTDKLDEMSRLDLASVHTIQHNLKVKPFGTVNGAFLTALVHQFNSVWAKTPDSMPSAASGSRQQAVAGGRLAATVNVAEDAEEEEEEEEQSDQEEAPNEDAVDEDEEEIEGSEEEEVEEEEGEEESEGREEESEEGEAEGAGSQNDDDSDDSNDDDDESGPTTLQAAVPRATQQWNIPAANHTTISRSLPNNRTLFSSSYPQSRGASRGPR